MKLPAFFSTWSALLTTPAAYWSLIQAESSRLIWFFVISAMVLSLSQIALFQIRTLPEIKTQLTQTRQDFVAHYPAGLEVTWDGQKLSSNQQQPIAISYPKILNSANLGLPKHFSQLETRTNDINQVPDSVKNTTWSVITSENLWINDQAGTWNSLPLNTFLEARAIEVNRSNLPELAARVEQEALLTLEFFSQLVWVVVPLIFVLTGFWQAIINGILLYFILKLQRPNFTWNQSWKLALLITLVAALIEQIVIWLYPQLRFPMFNVTFWCVAILVMWSGRPRSA